MHNENDARTDPFVDQPSEDERGLTFHAGTRSVEAHRHIAIRMSYVLVVHALRVKLIRRKKTMRASGPSNLTLCLLSCEASLTSSFIFVTFDLAAI